MTVDVGARTRKAASGEGRRAYDSPVRQARAGATRVAVAQAARRLFAVRGWAGTRVRDVAAAAGVSEPTVYAAYGSKAGLAHALVDAIATVADPHRQETELAAATEPIGQLAAMVAFDRRLYQHGGDVLVVLRDAGRSEPDLAAAYAAGREDGAALRRRVFADWPRPMLRMDRDEAVDVYAALCNIDVYRVLTEERGWAPDRVERWLTETVGRVLLADPVHSGR